MESEPLNEIAFVCFNFLEDAFVQHNPPLSGTKTKQNMPERYCGSPLFSVLPEKLYAIVKGTSCSFCKLSILRTKAS